jgi:hypothetical protein
MELLQLRILLNIKQQRLILITIMHPHSKLLLLKNLLLARLNLQLLQKARAYGNYKKRRCQGKSK